MKNTNRNYLFNWLLYSSLALILFSCKQQNNLGLPDNPEPAYNAKFISGLQANAITVRHDTVQTDGLTTFLLGSYFDPYFGKVKAGFATQFFMPGASVNFGTSPILDSVVLSLAYTADPAFYGVTDATNGKLHIQVFELIQSLDLHAPYYSNTNTASYYDATKPLADIITIPDTKTNVVVNGVSQVPQLRIKLSADLGNKILNAGSSNLSNSDNFNAFFKGLIFTVQNDAQTSGQGSIVYLDPYSAATKLALYYNDSINFEFVIKELSAHINLFEHDYTGTPIVSQLNGTSTNNDLIYIQSMAGVKPLIKLPFLQSFRDSGRVAVNRCEIVFKPDLSTVTAECPLLDQLYLLGIDKDGKTVFLDDQVDGVKYGGAYDASAQEYRFNISRYAQQVINGSLQDFGLYLQGAGAGVKANRVVIKGNENILINLTYTKF